MEKKQQADDGVAKLLSRKKVFEGWRTLETIHLQPRSLKHDGYTEEMSREVYSIGKTAGVLLYCPETDEVLLNQQFRVGAWIAGEEDPFLFECALGMIDKGETAKEAAKREALEETGTEVIDLMDAGTFYPTPGVVAEEVFLYIGRIAKPTAGMFGLESEGEEIRTHIFQADDAIAMLDDGRMKNGIAALALSWFARHKDTIRAKWGAA